MAVKPTDEIIQDEELDESVETTEAVEETPASEDVAPEVQAGGDDVEEEAGAGPVFSSGALELAARTGLDPNDYKDEAAFYRAVARQDRSIAEYQRQFGGQRQGQAPAQPAQPVQPTTPQEQALKRLELEEYFRTTPEGEIDPNIVKAFKALHGDYYGHLDTFNKGFREQQSKFEALSKKFEELEARHQFEENRRFVAEWDAFFAGVGDDYKDKIGSGSQNEVSQLQLMTRDQVVGTALALKQMDVERGLRPLADKQYGQRALLSVLGQETNAAARKDILAKAKARTNSALANAKVKAAPAKDKFDRAWAVFNKKSKEIGLKRDDDE